MGTAQRPPRESARGPVRTKRIGTVAAAGCVLLGSAVFAFPGSVLAEEPPPVVDGDCTATLQTADGETVQDDSGQPLTVDAGALLNAPGEVDIGLGNGPYSSGPSSTDYDPPTLTLPAGDAVKALGVTNNDAVGPLTTTLCDGTQRTVNTLSAPVQEALPNDREAPPEEPAPEPPDEPNDPAPEPPDPQPPESPAPPEPGTPTSPDVPAGDEVSPIVPAPGVDESFDLVPDGSVPTGAAISGQPPVIAPNLPPDIPPNLPPNAPPVQAPNLNPPPQQGPPEVLADDSGSAQPMPASNSPDRLPMLVAVIALAISTAALVRTWFRRRAA